MQRSQAHARPREERIDPATEGDAQPRRDASPSEAIHIRSYDYQWSYDLDVEIVTTDGQAVFENRYYLLPGHTESESGVVPGGEYELRVTLDNTTTETLECRIDPSPAHTAVIEVGNGAVALTEGLGD